MWNEQCLPFSVLNLGSSTITDDANEDFKRKRFSSLSLAFSLQKNLMFYSVSVQRITQV